MLHINGTIERIDIMSNSQNMPKNENIKRTSILKSGSPEASRLPPTCKKCATFDEDNIIKTLHPKDKDYGNQIITETKTPFERPLSDKSKPVDPQLLHAKLVDLEKQQLHEQQSSSSFATKRRQHYDEYKRIELAKLLLSQEENEDEETDATAPAAACDQ